MKKAGQYQNDLVLVVEVFRRTVMQLNKKNVHT